MVDVSVIIVNYNTWELTVDCIKSIKERTHGVTYEIIVVDNASADASVTNIRKACPDITIIESNENIGFGRANNLAAQSADGKYLFFLNSDTLLVNDAISVLKNYMDFCPNVGICGGNLYDKDMNPNHSHLRIFPSILNDFDLATKRLFSRLLSRDMQFNYSDNPIEVAYVTGADMMIAKSLFDQISGFDSDFFLYYEETELTYRVHRLGYKIMNVPSSMIIHLEGKSSTVSAFKMYVMQKSRLLFFSKCYSKCYCIVANLNYLLLNVLSILFCAIFKQADAKRLLKKMKVFMGLLKE